MSQLIVIKFDDMEQAGKVREALRAQEKQGLIKMEDAEVIVCDADGKIEKKGETDRGVKIGAVGGGMLGLLLGFVFFPIGGLLLGAAAGALIGKSLGTGCRQEVRQGRVRRPDPRDLGAVHHRR